MAERLIVVLGQVMTLFLMMGAGFGMGKPGKISSHGGGYQCVRGEMQ